MGIKNIITDDLTGDTIADGTKPTAVRVGGEDYEVYLSDESIETFIAFLKGEAPLLEGTKPAKASSTKATTDGGRQKTETYGYDYAEVKEWAIANGIKGKTGAPVTEKTTRIGQTVYDAYNEAQKAS